MEREHGSIVSGFGGIRVSVLPTAGTPNPDLQLSQMPRESFGQFSQSENRSVISSNLNQTNAPRGSSNFYFESQMFQVESENRRLAQQTPRPPTLTPLPRFSEANNQLVYPEQNRIRYTIADPSNILNYTTQFQSQRHSQPPSTFKTNMQAISELENQLFPKEQIDIPVYILNSELVEEFKEQP